MAQVSYSLLFLHSSCFKYILFDGKPHKHLIVWVFPQSSRFEDPTVNSTFATAYLTGNSNFLHLKELQASRVTQILSPTSVPYSQ